MRQEGFLQHPVGTGHGRYGEQKAYVLPSAYGPVEKPTALEGCAAHLMVGEPLTENADTKIGRPSAAEKVRMFARCI